VRISSETLLLQVSEKKLKDENSWLKAMLNETQGCLSNSDGEPPKKKRREEVLISETDLCGEEIQAGNSTITTIYSFILGK
jgi:hypothetical protein